MLSFLLALADESDHDKIMYIYDTCQNDMLRVARAVLKQRSAPVCNAEDVVQETYVRIIERLNYIDFNRTAPEVKRYVLTITCNMAKYLYRKDREQLLSFEEYEERIGSEDEWCAELNLQNQYEIAVDALVKMDDRYSIPLQLYIVDQFSVKKIASMLDMKEKTVYTNLRRGRILLKKMCHVDVDEDEHENEKDFEEEEASK